MAQPTTAKKPQTAFNELTATEIVDAVASGRASCETVMRGCLDHIAAREPHVQAWQHLDPQQAINAARALDASGRRGPLFGVPFGIARRNDDRRLFEAARWAYRQLI